MDGARKLFLCVGQLCFILFIFDLLVLLVIYDIIQQNFINFHQSTIGKVEGLTNMEVQQNFLVVLCSVKNLNLLVAFVDLT